MEYLPSIISALGTIIAAWFAYNQYTKNKMTDMKIEQFKREETEKSQRRNDNSAIVFGELWNVLYALDADRVYIVQPHPLGNESLLSVYYEVKRKGIEGMRDKVHNLKMAEVPKFAADLSQTLFMCINDIDVQVHDKYAKALLSSCGCNAVIIKRLSDNRYDWVGSIFCEFTHSSQVQEEIAHEVLHDAATTIQYILPEFR